jgi:hypothetical protein
MMDGRTVSLIYDGWADCQPDTLSVVKVKEPVTDQKAKRR